jgi:hypothetical protein
MAIGTGSGIAGAANDFWKSLKRNVLLAFNLCSDVLRGQPSVLDTQPISDRNKSKPITPIRKNTNKLYPKKKRLAPFLFTVLDRTVNLSFDLAFFDILAPVV